MSLREEALSYAKSLCYLRDPRKMRMHVRNNYGFSFSTLTMQCLLDEYLKTQQERRSFKPEQSRELVDDEIDGIRMINKARKASDQLAAAVSQFMECRAA